MECRNVDVLCVQETQWKGAKARFIEDGNKIWYCGSDSKRNGVGIIMKKDLVDRVVEVWRRLGQNYWLEAGVRWCYHQYNQCVCAAARLYIRGKGSFLVKPGRDCRNDYERREG